MLVELKEENKDGAKMAGISQNLTYVAGAVNPTCCTPQIFWKKYNKNNKSISIFNVILTLISSYLLYHPISLISFIPYISHLIPFYIL